MTKWCTLCYNKSVCCGVCFVQCRDAVLPEFFRRILWKGKHVSTEMCCENMMKKNYNRDQFKRIFSFFAAVLLVGLYAAGFAWVWYESYSDAILLPFYRRGNWVMILIYVVLVLLFAKSFGGLKIGYLKRTDMFYSQTLSIFCVNVVTYFQISVVNRDFSAAVPMILLTIADLAVLILWIVLTNRLCFRLYPPRKLVVIYGDRNAAELVLKMSRRVDKYMICESVSANAPPEEIQEAIARYEGIILCEVSGKLRNDLIKYCFAQNVRAYIAPKISDIILRGAEEIRLFDTPEEALSAAAEAPAAAEENRLRLSWEGGALTHNVQAYMRAASEGEQGLQTSPYAVVYNFTPKKTEDVMYLRDITDGEKADGTLIQLEFVSYSKKGVPSFRYAILPLA